jgi:hypothetical protein
MERRTRCEHFLSAALSITDDLLHRNILLLRPKATSKALDLAGQQIDTLGDPSTTAEERQKRKRRLMKGRGEFRDIRSDLPKPKS